jgi:hypothetical protein
MPSLLFHYDERITAALSDEIETAQLSWPTPPEHFDQQVKKLINVHSTSTSSRWSMVRISTAGLRAMAAVQIVGGYQIL